MKQNKNLIKNKYLIIISAILLVVGGYSLNINNYEIFTLNKAEAIRSPNANTDGTTNNGADLTVTQTTTVCNNGASNPPLCTALNGTCINPTDPYPSCPTKNGFSKTYLPMAASGLALTAGIVETSVNIEDARTKYLSNISETNSIKQELVTIAALYNRILEDAQLRRNQKLGITGSNNYCTFSELIQYQEE